MMKENKRSSLPAERSGRAGIYVHVPFCIQKCIYCDFNSIPGCDETLQSGYFDALKTEIESFRKAWENSGTGVSSADAQDSAGVSRAFADTLFIGGGTPSCVDPSLIEDLMDCIKGIGVKASDGLGIGKKGENGIFESRSPLLSDDGEITMELNPKTASPESLKRYRNAGINRLSIGVQSFQDDELRFLGRIHTASDAVTCFQNARAAGFENINLDLIFGFPGNTTERWRDTLEQALALKPDHISFYSLQIEEGTPLYEMFRKDIVDQVSDEVNRQMYHDAIMLLEKSGYHHYEISNAALPGKECRHNLKYWSMEDYAGFGVSAHSYLNVHRNVAERSPKREEYTERHETGEGNQSAESFRGGIRYYNEDDLNAYIQRMEKNRSGNRGYQPLELYENSLRDEISESIFTGLRKKEGLAIRWFDDKFRSAGVTFAGELSEKIAPFVDQGYLVLEEDRLRFTIEGFDISNYILSELI